MSSMREITIEVANEKIKLNGILSIPEKAETVVVFVHGSGSSIISKRNHFLAALLVEQGISILLIDLLTQAEEQTDLTTSKHRFDIAFLGKRLSAVEKWLKKTPETTDKKISYFGSGTGAAAALLAASSQESRVSSIVLHRGRADLASAVLHDVRSPTLFINSGYDFEISELNKNAYDLLTVEKKLEHLPNTTHLFEEAEVLQQVALHSGNWFRKHQS